MIELSPFERLFQSTTGEEVPLPPSIRSIYGPLVFPSLTDRPRVVSNFVATLDGVVTLSVPGKDGGRAISGNNAHDRLLMATLCAIADAVVIGAGTLKTSSGHIWTSTFLDPDFADVFATLRRSLGKTDPPLNVVVTGHGDINPSQRMFQTDDVPTLIVTSEQGAARLRSIGLPAHARLEVAGDTPSLDPRAVLDLITPDQPSGFILLQAGPRLTSDFLAARLVDEMFLTLAPQIAGRDAEGTRPGFVTGHLFAPDDPLWGDLVDVRRAGNHLFLRYMLPSVLSD